MRADLMPMQPLPTHKGSGLDERLCQQWRRQLESEWQSTWATLTPTPHAASEGVQEPQQVGADQGREPALAPRQAGSLDERDAVRPRALSSSEAPSPLENPPVAVSPTYSTVPPVFGRLADFAAATRPHELDDTASAAAGLDARLATPLGSGQPRVGGPAPSMLEEAMAMEPARQDSPWDLGVRAERAKAEKQDMQAFFQIRETGTHAVLASMRDASLGQAESVDLARSLSYTLMKMGYARTRVYVNGATSPGASAPSASTISRKDMSHGD